MGGGRGLERKQEEARGSKRTGEDRERKKRKKNEKKGGKEMEYYNEYEPHGEVEECTWQVWGSDKKR